MRLFGNDISALNNAIAKDILEANIGDDFPMMHATMWLSWAWVLLLLLEHTSSGQSRMSLRDMFENSFNDRCGEYPFVHAYENMLDSFVNQDNSNLRFLIFVYNEKGLESGGFGDRMGGMITAFANALRFKRRLLIKSNNGFDEYFRPFSRKKYDSTTGMNIDWKNQKEWTGFSTWKQNNPQYTDKNKSEWEYNLSDCVSNTQSTFPESTSRRCAMDDGDVPHPVVKLASNRAYLCRWDSRSELRSHKDLRKILKLKAKDNLFEAAGCMLRMIMWPTDRLWEAVDEAYKKGFMDDFKYQLYLHHELTMNNFHRKELLLQQMEKIIPSNYTMIDNPAIQFGLQFRCGDWWSYRGRKFHHSQEDTNACVVSPNDTLEDIKQNSGKSQYMRAGTPLEIGRCTFGLLNHAIYHFNISSMPPPMQATIEYQPSSGNSGTISGNVYSISSFYHLLVPYHKSHPYFEKNASFYESNSNTDIEHTTNNVDGGPISSTKKSKTSKKNKNKKKNKFVNILKSEPLLTTWKLPQYIVFVTSDNVHGALQIRDAAMGKYDPSWDNFSISEDTNKVYVVSPQGCHIDLDKSSSCFAFTATYWFLLALSDVYVTQTFGSFASPTSAFSRFAGIYSLKTASMPFRSGKLCGDDVFTMTTMSRFEQGNWYCQ